MIPACRYEGSVATLGRLLLVLLRGQLGRLLLALLLAVLLIAIWRRGSVAWEAPYR